MNRLAPSLHVFFKFLSLTLGVERLRSFVLYSLALAAPVHATIISHESRTLRIVRFDDCILVHICGRPAAKNSNATRRLCKRRGDLRFSYNTTWGTFAHHRHQAAGTKRQASSHFRRWLVELRQRCSAVEHQRRNRHALSTARTVVRVLPCSRR